MSDPSIDHTKIDIRFDPTIQRMDGIARHGNVRFSVPFISQIEGNLWQGGCESGLQLPHFIEHVVSLYPWERYRISNRHPNIKSELYVRMYDSVDQSFDQVEELADYVNRRTLEGPTLVHCQAGLNRSSLVAALALTKRGASGAEAIALIREKRSPACLCNPAFFDFINAISA